LAVGSCESGLPKRSPIAEADVPSSGRSLRLEIFSQEGQKIRRFDCSRACGATAAPCDAQRTGQTQWATRRQREPQILVFARPSDLLAFL
jgi:hypothetical protein